MKVAINGRSEAEAALAAPHTYTAVCSIGRRPDPDDPWNWVGAEFAPLEGFETFPVEKRVHLACDDVTRTDLDGGWVAPTDDDVKRVIAWARGLDDDDHALFHCAAGISRSTAAAHIALCARGRPPLEAAAEVLAARSPVPVRPNALMLIYADELLNTKPHEGLRDAWHTLKIYR